MWAVGSEFTNARMSMKTQFTSEQKKIYDLGCIIGVCVMALAVTSILVVGAGVCAFLVMESFVGHL